MNSEDFVEIIRSEVMDSAVESVIQTLENPPGRNPAKDLLARATWYKNLQQSDKKMVDDIVADAAYTAVFGFLCVLDGVRAIENKDKGVLKLYYERREELVLLNDRHKFGLHELL